MSLGVIIAVLAYLGALGFLAWLGHQRTKPASDYLIAGRQIHPYVMAMSHGATFISTSAIVGFGGVAGMFGMSLLWLTFLNRLPSKTIPSMRRTPYTRDPPTKARRSWEPSSSGCPKAGRPFSRSCHKARTAPGRRN